LSNPAVADAVAGTTGTLSGYFDRLKADFQFFCDQLWKAMGWDTKAPIGWAERDIMDWVASGPDELGVLAPRGLGKTHIVTISYTLWSWLRDPDTKVIVASKSSSFAVETVEFVRQCVRAVPFLKHMSPRKGQKDSAYAFTISSASDARQPSIRAFGIEGSLEGNRAHIIIADDMEQDGNTETYQAREKLFDRTNEFSAMLYRPEPGETVKIRRRIIYVGTYHAEPIHSMYYRLHTERGVTFRTWPLVYPKPKERCLNLAPAVADRLAENSTLAGTSVFDHRIGPAEIAKQYAKGRTYWNRQQALLVEDERGVGRRLSLADLAIMDVDPKMAPPHIVWGTRDSQGDTALDDIPTLGIGSERLHRPAFIPNDRIPYKQTVAYIDPAGVGEDEACITVVGTLGALFHVKLCRGVLIARDFDGNQYAAFKSMVADAQRLGATRLAYEDNNDTYNGLGSMIQQACRELGYQINVEQVHSAGVHKNVRILKLLEPVMSRHRLIIDRKSIVPVAELESKYQLQYQLSHLTEERDCLTHDDRIDSLAGAVGMLADELDRDTVVAAETDSERALRQAIDRIDRELDRMSGRYRPSPRWMDRYSDRTVSRY